MVPSGSMENDQKERYYVVNVGKRLLHRGKDRPRDGKKTWYVKFITDEGAIYFWDCNRIAAFVWKLRSLITPYSPNNDEYV